MWTHVLGFFLFFGLALYCFLTEEVLSADAPLGGRVAIGFYFVTVMICMALSSVFHLFYCHSDDTLRILSKCDHVGIILLLCGSDVPTLYFGFAAYPKLQLLYLVLLPIVILGGILAIISPYFAHPERRNTRVALMLTVVLFGWFHMGHEVILKGGVGTEEGMTTLRLWLYSFGFYALGLVFYVTRIPERYTNSGRFDYVVRSLAVLCGIFLAFFSALLISNCLLFSRCNAI